MLLRRLAPALVAASLTLTASAQDAPIEAPNRDGGDAPPVATDDAPPAGAVEEASTSKAGHGSVEVRLGYYFNDDGGDDGNPFLDEELEVLEPAFVLDFNITDRLAVHAKGNFDDVSSASIERLSQYGEQSGASGDGYVGGELGFSYQLNDTIKLGVHGSYSKEYDYESLGLGADVSLELFDKNTTLSFGVNGFSDTIRVIRFDGSEGGDDDRVSLTFNAGWYQVLSPRLHMSLGAVFTHQSGFLETAFNGVVLESATDPPNPTIYGSPRGVEVAEELPDTRERFAVFGEVRRFFDTGTGIGAGTRLYADSWGILSGALELKLFQWIVPEVLRFRVRYRFYVQSAADAYDEHFLIDPADRAAFVANEDRTQDSDLGAYSSHTIGLRFTVHITDYLKFDVGGDYVLRDDGIDQYLISGGVRFDW